MAQKSYSYAVLEGVAQEMRANDDMVFYYEYHRQAATLPTGELLDLATEFGWHRTSGMARPVDQQWIVGAAIGAPAAGSNAIARLPTMAQISSLEFLFTQAGKL